MGAKLKRGNNEEPSTKTDSFLIILLNLWKNDESLGRNQRIIELYESGLSMKEVGLGFGITGQRVEQIIKKAGIQTRKYTRSNRLLEARKKKRKVLEKKLLLKLYNDTNLSLSEITEKLNVSHISLYKSLEYHNIPKRKKTEFRVSKLTEEVLRQMYLEEDLTATEIARRLGFASITIKKRLSKFGIRKRDRKT